MAFTAVWGAAPQAGVFVVSLGSGTWAWRPSPPGWEDYLEQWNSAGTALLLRRHPQPAQGAEAGLLSMGMVGAMPGGVTALTAPQRVLHAPLPHDEPVASASWSRNGHLLIRTHPPTNALYLVSRAAARNAAVREVDSSPEDYGQERVVEEGGKLAVVVVRPMSGAGSPVALYRWQDGTKRRLSGPLLGVVWSYVSASGKWLLVARTAANGKDWDWTLYSVSAMGVRLVTTRRVPADVVSVYWSPNERWVLGAAGERLWLVSVPDLLTRQLGSRRNWNADDATWLGPKSGAVAVAANGELWRVSVPSGAALRCWRFPRSYWY